MAQVVVGKVAGVGGTGVLNVVAPAASSSSSTAMTTVDPAGDQLRLRLGHFNARPQWTKEARPRDNHILAV